MRAVLLSIAVASIIAAFGAACTAAGSTTVVGGPEGGTTPGTDPGPSDTSDGGTSTTPTDYDALFGPPASSTSTPNSVNGLWAGSDSVVQDLRLKLSDNTVLIAQRCGSSMTVGLTAVGRVTSSSIGVLESKTASPPVSSSSGGATKGCTISVMPTTVPRCTSTTAAAASDEGLGLDNGCFFLADTTLNFYGSTTLLANAKLTKLSD